MFHIQYPSSPAHAFTCPHIYLAFINPLFASRSIFVGDGGDVMCSSMVVVVLVLMAMSFRCIQLTPLLFTSTRYSSSIYTETVRMIQSVVVSCRCCICLHTTHPVRVYEYSSIYSSQYTETVYMIQSVVSQYCCTAVWYSSEYTSRIYVIYVFIYSSRPSYTYFMMHEEFCVRYSLTFSVFEDFWVVTLP